MSTSSNAARPAGATATSLLAVTDLVAGYRGATVLHEVSLDVHPGEIVVVIGSNGAGKSTLLRAISGTLTPRSGTVVFDGADVTGQSPHQLVRLGIAHVPEGRQVFPRLTVEENLALGAFTRSARDPAVRRRHADVLALFPRLAERRRQHAESLSGGEQQMLAIGRGLMSMPRLLVIDEPTLGLAPIIIERLLEHFEAIRRDLGITVVVAEQNHYLLGTVATRVYQLVEGRCRPLSDPGASAHVTSL